MDRLRLNRWGGMKSSEKFRHAKKMREGIPKLVRVDRGNLLAIPGFLRSFRIRISRFNKTMLAKHLDQCGEITVRISLTWI